MSQQLKSLVRDRIQLRNQNPPLSIFAILISRQYHPSLALEMLWRGIDWGAMRQHFHFPFSLLLIYNVIPCWPSLLSTATLIVWNIKLLLRRYHTSHSTSTLQSHPPHTLNNLWTNWGGQIGNFISVHVSLTRILPFFPGQKQILHDVLNLFITPTIRLKRAEWVQRWKTVLFLVVAFFA